MTKQFKADLLLLSITAIWGSSFVLMKNVLEHIPSFAYLTLRFFIASILLLVFFHKKLKFLNYKVLVSGSVIGLMLFGGMAFQVYGLYYTTASNSAFITGLNVVLVPIFSSIMLKKKPDRSSAIGVVIAFIGLFFLSGGLSLTFNLGDFLTFLCAICFAFQIIFIDKFTDKQDPILLSVLQVLIATFLYGMVWGIYDPKPVSFDRTVLVTLIITGVLGTALAFAGQTFVQRFTSPTRTALIFTAEPVFGAIFALLIPNSQGMTETLKVNAVIGCILILTGMLVSEIKFNNSKRILST